MTAPGSGAEVRESAAQALDVLVVDDSAVVRQLLSTLLTERGGLRVATAADPLIAMRKMEKGRPDVVVLDIEMPRMDGLTFLRKIMAEDPLPVVICSSHAGRGSRAAMDALAEGAVDIVRKPTLGVRDFLRDSALMLVDTVRAASMARVRRRGSRATTHGRPRTAPPPRRRPAARRPAKRVVAIGVSTGGPEALGVLLGGLSPDCPGLVVVQHMPAGFTASLAQRLNQVCAIEVREARSGDLVVPGRALIAPGNRHLELVRHGESHAVAVVDGPLVSRHRPSVDVLFRSVARTAGPDAVGVIMTGMGVDGAEGLCDMKRAGAFTLAQDESTCVVFGMPRAAIERECVDEVVPLHEMAALVTVVCGLPRSSTGTAPAGVNLRSERAGEAR